MNSARIYPFAENRCSIECFLWERGFRRAARAGSRPGLAIALLSGLLFLAVTPARAQTLTVLHSFGSAPDGSNSKASLIRDQQGNFYGTTDSGGGGSYGTVFMMSPSGVEKVLYNFTTGADGESPWGSLVRDSQGNLYGTTWNGGAYNDGTVFMTTRSGVETVLHSFGAGTDGLLPAGGLVRDAQGNLYGTTVGGGVNLHGTVFQITAAGVESVLHSFTGADGNGPYAALVQDSAGNLYGTTNVGGAHGYGVVFKITLAGTLTVLYNFAGGNDGGVPYGSVVRDAQGNVFGTTYQGGVFGYGTVFEVNTFGAERVIHSFARTGIDGGQPIAGLIQDPNGTLYGTTYYGGAYNYGTIFLVIPASNIFSTMYSFTAGTDGGGPWGGLVEDSQGFLYGTTQWYGTNGWGTVFKFVH